MPRVTAVLTQPGLVRLTATVGELLSCKLDSAQLTFLMAHIKNLFCSENFSSPVSPAGRPECRTRVCVEAHSDRVLTSDERVLENLLLSEHSVKIRDYCHHTQTTIKPHMRKIVTDWMLEVCEDQHCQSEVFFLAVNYLDRFLSLVNIKKTQFQLVASVCILLASKFSQVVPISSEQLVIYTDNSVSVEQLRHWEIEVLNVLQWELSASTAHSFLQHFCSNSSLKCSTTITRQAAGVAALACTEYKFILTKQSVIAAAALAASLEKMEKMKTDELVLSLATIVKCSVTEINFTLKHLRGVMDHFADSDSESGYSSDGSQDGLKQEPCGHHPALSSSSPTYSHLVSAS